MFLNEVTNGDDFLIKNINLSEQDIKYLGIVGIKENEVVNVDSNGYFDGSKVVKIGVKRILLNSKYANNIEGVCFLKDCKPGDEFTIKNIDGIDNDKLHYLVDIGICPGENVQVVGEGYLKGSLVILVNNQRYSIGKKVVEAIQGEKVLEKAYQKVLK